MVRSPRASSARMRGGGGSYPLRHRIIPARMERMTFENPADSEPRAFERAMARDGLVGVARARRLEATLREHEVRQRELVATNESHYDRPRAVYVRRRAAGFPAAGAAADCAGRPMTDDAER